GHCLPAHLDKADHRHETTEIPQPAHKQVTLVAAADAEGGEKQDKNGGCERLPQRKRVLRMGVINDEIDRPEGSEEIEDIRPECIGDPNGNREKFICSNGIGASLGEQGDIGAARREEQEGQLFEDQRPELCEKERKIFTTIWDGKAGKGPIVEEQQRKRKGDNHRLGPKANGKKSGNDKIAGDAWFAGVPSVGEQRQKKEERAEERLAFRDPGNALDVKRMQRKEGGDKKTAPEKARGGNEQ